jgi:DNA-binding Lrp family transcriptional regulator
MDDLDGRIISALRHDARLPLSDLAAQLDTSRTTLRARIARLQERGDIVGFTVLTRADVMRDPVRGLMMIGIEGPKGSPANLAVFPRSAPCIPRMAAGTSSLRLAPTRLRPLTRP